MNVPFTLNEDVFQIGGDNSFTRIIRTGNVVSFNILLTVSVDAINNEQILQINDCFPFGRYDFNVVMFCNGEPRTTPIVLYAHGDMYVNSMVIPAGSSIHINGTYITNNI